MGQEIELKMTIDEMDVERLCSHTFIARHATGPAVSKHLVNRYFDTPDQMLRRHDMALRIRFDGSMYVQTLKQKGKSRNGLTVRGEWEWGVAGPHIDPHLVPSGIWPLAMESSLDRLVPLFRTDFRRTVWPLQVQSENRSDLRKPTRVEMSLDQGAVTTDAGDGVTREEAILEVEFELLEGDTDVLFEISTRLGQKIRLTPCNISKAERGYRLLNAV